MKAVRSRCPPSKAVRSDSIHEQETEREIVESCVSKFSNQSTKLEYGSHSDDNVPFGFHHVSKI